MPKEMIISTGSINCYGSRILTEGINIEQYKKNPVLLWMHQRPYGGGSPLPIGRVENIHVDGDKLIGTPVFDMEDEFAKKIAQKWEKGFLKMCSAGLEIIEVSTDKEVLLAGQTRPTITKSKLNEVSIVDIGANDDALQLMHEGKTITLAAGQDSEVLPIIDNSQPITHNSDNMNEKILLALGLSKDATEAEALSAIASLQKDAKEVSSLRLSAITAAVNTAIAEKRITEANRDHFVELGKKVGIESLQTTLALMTPAVKPTDIIKGAQAQETLAFKGTWDELDRADKLSELKEKDYALFCKKYEEKFGEKYVEA